MVEATKVLIELHYLPNLQYFSKLFQYDKLELEGMENYVKGSYRNRCHIGSVNGILRLSIPLHKGKHQQKPIKEVRLSKSENWQRTHWRGIQSAYGKAPYFDYYADQLAPFFIKPYKYLFDFNFELFDQLVRIIAPEKSFTVSENYSKITPERTIDLRDQISPKNTAPSNNSCFKHPVYPQIFEDKHGFIPGLSILDALFCTGPEVSLILKNAIVKKTKEM